MWLIHENPQLTHCDLARRLDVSLGKANYCVKALVEKGFVKAGFLSTPRNSELTWGGGHGRRPQRINDWQSSGRKLEDACVP